MRKMGELKYVLSIILITTSLVNGLSQNILNYKAVVLTSIDSSALPSAHVYFENPFIGTVTNLSGEFVINFCDSLLTKNIAISCIGYMPKSISLVEVLGAREKYDTIFLEQDIITLSEVIVNGSKRDTLVDFLKTVLNRANINYPADGHFSKGFYRQISQNGDSATRLIEAAIEIQDPGYTKMSNKVKIRVNQFRKSNDYVNYSWTKMLEKLLIGTKNDLIETYKTDFIRSKTSFLYTELLSSYNLELDSIIGKTENKLACISFHSNLDLNQPYFCGYIYVNLADLAIKKIVYSWMAHPNFKFARQDLVFYEGQYRFKKIIEYQKIGLKYYPLFISSFEPLNGVTGMAGKLQFKESIVLINETIIDRDKYYRIKRKDVEKEDEDFYERSFPYNSEFWDNYNILLINPLNQNQRFSLEKKQKLRAQFERNGKGKK